MLGARLMAALRAQRPDLAFAGIGGPQMAAAGLASLFPMQDLALMGLLEVLPRLHQLRRRLRQTVADIAARRPDVVVTIDSPGFTLRLLKRDPATRRQARALRGATGLGVARTPRAALSRPVGSVALPAAVRAGVLRPPWPAGDLRRPSGAGERRRSTATRRGSARRTASTPDARVLTLMPGSRRTEVSRLLPILGATLQRLPECDAGRADGRTGGGCGARGHTRLAAPADIGDRICRTSTTHSLPRRPR